MSSDYFKVWRNRSHHKGKTFISDGIIDESRWSSCKLKVLFLLKEAYSDEGDSDWDLCQLIRDKWKGPKYFTMYRVAEWAYGLQSLANGKFEVHPEDGELLKEALLSSAVVNIKKSDGKPSSDTEDLKSYVERDWDLIEKQINDYEPDLVVGGNTWSLIAKKLDDPRPISTWVYSAFGGHFIDAYHPAYRVAAVFSYHAVCSLVNQSGILIKGSKV